MTVHVNQAFNALADCNDDFILYSSRFGGDNEAQTADNANGGYWCWTSTGSPSSSTGPPSGTACMYTETSSPSAVGDIFYAELRTAINAQQNDIHTVSFQTCTYGNTAGYLYFDAWDGTQWNNIASWAGNSTTTFTSRGPYDFGPSGYDYTNTDFKIRFRVVTGGTAYQNDFAVDTVYIEYDSKASLEQEGFRGYNDGTESGSTPIANQDVNFSIAKDVVFQMRMLLNATGDPPSQQYLLEYKEASDAATEYRGVLIS